MCVRYAGQLTSTRTWNTSLTQKCSTIPIGINPVYPWVLPCHHLRHHNRLNYSSILVQEYHSLKNGKREAVQERSGTFSSIPEPYQEKHGLPQTIPLSSHTYQTAYHSDLILCNLPPHLHTSTTKADSL